MEFIKPGTNIPFTRYRHIALILSTVVNLAVLALLFTKGPNLGVDFAGGTMVHLKFQQKVSIPEIRRGLSDQFGQDRFEVRRVESVGPKVGKDLRQRGTWSVIAATLMMGVYIWVRFGFSFGARFGLHFGLGAVIALIHDVLVTAGALMLAHYAFDLTVVAALLTIVGFSANDT